MTGLITLNADSEFYLKIKPNYAMSEPISTCTSKHKVIHLYLTTYTS